MRKYWLFRTNLKNLEYYHKYQDLETFKKNCHDFYLLQGLWYIEKNLFDEVIVWRLQPKIPQEDIIFNIDGRKFIQRWCNSFRDLYGLNPPQVSLFRGGFQEYGTITNEKPKQFGNSLYLGSGKRIFPKYNGKYKTILLEDEKDFHNSYKCKSFYKTANKNIFHPIKNTKKIFDLCWPVNFSQITQKGQEFFIKSVQQNSYLRKLKIVHCGNQSEVGEKLCKKYGVKNIKFMGWLNRPQLNEILNQSRCGIVTSNKQDGCPRTITEILMSGIPLLIRDQTRLLDYYKHSCGVTIFNDKNISGRVQEVIENIDKFDEEVNNAVIDKLQLSTICTKNFEGIWT